MAIYVDPRTIKPVSDRLVGAAIEAVNEDSGGGDITSDNITDATVVGKAILTAEDADAARTAIGAGTSNLEIGTTATTAKAGDYAPTWAQVTDKPAVIAAGADASAARTAIGAGTSSLELGTSSTTAAAGDHDHAIAADTDSGLAAAANLQDAFVALSARIKALEDAAV